MKLSVDFGAIRKKIENEESALTLIKEAGFDGVDYGLIFSEDNNPLLKDDYRKTAEKSKVILDKLGLCVGQSHAPFSIAYNNEFNENDPEFLKLVRAIEYASIIDAKNIVVHFLKNNLPEGTDIKELNLRFYKSLIPYAKKFNMKISVENLFFRKKNPKEAFKSVFGEPDNVLEFIKELDSDVFNMCYDLGHSAITGYMPEDVIRRIGNKISILHVQDTDYLSDSHFPPFTLKHNWDEIAKALAESGYKGDFSIEIPTFFERTPTELIPIALKYVHNAGRLIIEKIDSNIKIMYNN